jgi:hypothetical protein
VQASYLLRAILVGAACYVYNIGRDVGEQRHSIRDILARAREYNFLVNLAIAAWVAVSAMGALVLRAYQSFGVGNMALLAVSTALVGIWGVPRIFARVRPRRPTFGEAIASLAAGLLVLFVWTANLLPHWIRQPDTATSQLAMVPKTDYETLQARVKTLEYQIANSPAQASDPPHPAQPINVTPTMPPLAAFIMLDRIREMFLPIGADTASTNLNWAVLITAPEENHGLRDLLINLFDRALPQHIQFIHEDPNDLDFPAIPQPTKSGIILHGTNSLNRGLNTIFAQCFVIYTTDNTLEKLNTYKYIRPGFIPVWIEIGNGSPWKIQRPGC